MEIISNTSIIDSRLIKLDDGRKERIENKMIESLGHGLGMGIIDIYKDNVSSNLVQFKFPDGSTGEALEKKIEIAIMAIKEIENIIKRLEDGDTKSVISELKKTISNQ